MWQNKAKPGSPKPDTPMRHLARQVLTTSPDDQEVKVRSVNLAVRFGAPEIPDTVQEDLNHLTDLTTPPVNRQLPSSETGQSQVRHLAPEAVQQKSEENSLVAHSDPLTGGEKSTKHDLDVEKEQDSGLSVAQLTTTSPVEEVQRDEQKNQIRQSKLYANLGIAPRPIKEAELTIRSPKLREESLSGHRPRRFDSFADVVRYAQEQFPNPREMQLHQKPEYQTWLIAQLANCHSRAHLERLAYSMDYKDLAIIFPTLASLKTGAEIDKLLHLLVIRPSKYLYIQGWLTLQYAYPRSTVQKGLAILCEVLEESETIKPTLQVEEMAHLDGLMLGAEHFDWESVHLISEISLPNTRHFMSSIIKFLRDSQMSGEDFFQRYGIYRDLALGQAISSQWEMAAFESSIHANQPAQSLFSRA